VLHVIPSALEARVSEGRDLLSALNLSLQQFGASPDDLRTLAASVRQLDDFFLLVVVGEFNAGKSALINALVGTAVMEEGVTPTTAQVTLLKYGEHTSRTPDPTGVQIVTAPVDLLRSLHIVDTPGTNAIIREHERLTTDFVPRSDLVLFLTSADRPFTETERQLLALLRQWGKKIVLVVNKVDVLATADDRDHVLAFVRRSAQQELGGEPTVLGVSARLAMRAKHGEPALWASSGFDALESVVRDLLQPDTSARLKLANPIGVGRTLALRYREIADQRLALLKGDIEQLGEIERQMTTFREDMARGFQLRMDSIEKVLTDTESRGQRYFEDTLRIGRVVDLLNRARMQKEFTETVIADTPLQIERRVSDLVDWLVDQEFREWQTVTRALASRRDDAAKTGAAEVGTFHNDRARLMDSVGREAQRAVDTFDKQREAGLIADQARVAVAAAAAAGGAAVGLGTLVTVAASTVAADVTGILLASALLGIGFLVIPARRRAAKTVLSSKLAELTDRLRTALRTEFERAQERTALRLRDVVAPYGQFVRAEHERWSGAREALDGLAQRLAALADALDIRKGPPETAVP
jgi:small GTP-binding protein